MEILGDDNDDESNKIIDSKKEKIFRAIEGITQLITKYENEKDIELKIIIMK